MVEMNFSEAKSEVKQLLSRVDPSDVPRLINWIRESGEPPGPQNQSPDHALSLEK